MAYVVLARKYRPQSFADMVGQDHITRTLTHAILKDRVHHAYLLCGARGLGKTTAARILAKALVCEKGPTPEPCNACHQCIAVNESRSVDVIEIDGASNNSVDDVRGLREQIHYLPQSARRKIYIIDEVHMLSTSAFNALLKTLEEPPAHVNFVLATTEPQKLPATILSRVSRLEVRRLASEAMAAHLRAILEREGAAVDDDGLRLIARASGGSVRDALTLLDQVLAFADDTGPIAEDHVRRVLGQADRGAVADLIDDVLAGEHDGTMAKLDALLGAGHDVVVLAVQMLEQLRDLMVVKLCSAREVMVDATESELARLRERTAGVEATRIGQAFDRLARTLDELQTSRAPRLLLEVGVLEISHTAALMPVGEAIARLEAIAAGTPAPPAAATRPRQSPAPAPAPPRAAANESPRPSPAPPAKARAPERSGSPGRAPGGSISDSLWNLARERGVVDAPSPEADTPGSDDEEPPPAGASVRASASASAPAPTPDPGPRTPAASTAAIPWEQLEPLVAWERLVARIRLEDDYLAAVLGEVGLKGLGPGRLSLVAPERSFAGRELQSRGDLRAALEQAIRSHFAGPLEVELEADTPRLPDLPSLSLLEAQRRRDLEARVAAEAREHPAIRRLVEVFEAEVSSVRPLTDPPAG